MTSKQRVKQAIHFGNPDKIPVYLFNKDKQKSDIIACPIGESGLFKTENNLKSEWGFVWQKIDNTMGQPLQAVIQTLQQYDSYKAPNANLKQRYAHIPQFIKEHSNQYIMASAGITGFTIVTFIRGFENTLEDLYLERDKIEGLIDKVFAYEEGVIENVCQFDIDAVSFYDDWGTQNSLIIDPKLWREIFLPRYKKQFDIAKKYGKDVYFHSCGNVIDIIPDLIQAGVDVFNSNQAEVIGINNLAKFKGKVCFNCPVDLQKVAIKGNKQTIYDYTKKLVDELGTENGGFIGYVEEYSSIGLSQENYNFQWNAALEYNAKNHSFKKQKNKC